MVENPRQLNLESIPAEQKCQLCSGPIDPATRECQWCGISYMSKEGAKEPSEVVAEKTLSETEKDETLTKWLSGEPISAETVGKDAESDEELKKWLTGTDEVTIEKWLNIAPASEPAPAEETPPPVIQPVILPELEVEEKGRALLEREAQLKAREEEIEKAKIANEELRKILESQLEKIKKGTFDPLKIIEESVSLHKELQFERKKRKSLEEEIEHVKKGSIAVIKYLKAQQAAAGAASELRKKVEEEEALREELEAKLRDKEAEIERLRHQLQEDLSKLPAGERELELHRRELLLNEKEEELKRYEDRLKTLEKEITVGAAERYGGDIATIHKLQDELRAREHELVSLQKSIALREEEIQQLRSDLRVREEELNKIKAPLTFKEEELRRREEDLRYREERLTREAKKVAEAKAKLTSVNQLEMQKRLEAIEREIAIKEAELRTKEKYIASKQRELELKSKGIIEQEIKMAEEELVLEFKQEKVKTGTPRLDDLLYGGIPFGTNILVYGPQFIGKEVLVYSFIAEGLRKGVPCILVITDKSLQNVREEFQYILPNFTEYERMGLVRYVDIYSRTVGETTTEPGVIYVEQTSDTNAILEAVDTIVNEYKKKKHEYHRLAFESLSTIMVRIGSAETFKFLQPFCGKRKKDKTVAMYTLDTGMHTDLDISTLGHIMDGEIDFKTEQMKNYLTVKGICEVQSRGWIQYTHSKRGLNIGSFALAHIR